MLPPPWKRRSLVCLLAAGCFLCCPAATLAQPAATPKLLLKLVSVKYLPDKGRVEYKLENDDPHSAATAYVVDISVVIRGKYDTWPLGGSSVHRDLLTLELGHQCQNAAADVGDDDDNPWPDVKIPPGVIWPGKERTDSITSSGLLPEYLLESATVEVNAHVTGVIWSDGRIEGTNDSAVQTLQRAVRDQWLEADREGRDVLAVLKAHPDDGDYQNRINEAIARLKSLMDGYPREVPVPSDEEPIRTMYLAEPGLVSATIRDLENAAYLPNPVARMTSTIEVMHCARERRAELQAPAMAGGRR